MPLASGTDLASYRIVGPLGAGAMGEVYRARDTRLGREVAIKVLPPHFAADAERLKRFEREARTLASLNHPNVAQIFHVDQVGETCFLVLELVEGETLEDRLKRGPVSVGESMDIVRQIAAGLEAAHEAGVIHRDLKPANVRLAPDGTVKVLDFGLAKPTREEGGKGSSIDSVLSTEEGRLIGTPTYMAPEQARAKPIDRRVDVWAMGCVLFECLTGDRAFAGETLSDVLASVIEREPDWSRLPRATPARVRRLLERCLVKDPRERLRDAGDARLELAAEVEAADESPASRRTTRGGLPLLAFTAGAALAAGAFFVASDRTAPPPASVARFSVRGTGMPIDVFQGLAISRDGKRLAFRSIGDDGRERLLVRPLDSLESTTLPGTELGWLPFFSPDGERLGFFSQGVLKAVSVSSGMARTIAAIDHGGYSGSAWLEDDTIVFTNSTRRIGRLPAAGGDVEFLELSGLKETDFVISPSPLPGGGAILCGVSDGNAFHAAVYDFGRGTLTRIAEDAFTPTWAASGHVLYQKGHEGMLMALPFDAERRTATGEPFPVIADLGARVSYQVRMFAVAENGTLAYIPNSRLLDTGALLWADRTGRAEPIVEIDRIVDMPRLSYDARRIAFRAPAPNCDVWIHDLERGVTARLTREGDNHGIAWLPGDSRVAFARFDAAARSAAGTAPKADPVSFALWSVMASAVDGAGSVEALSTPSISRAFVSSVSPDGRHVLVGAYGEAGSDVMLLTVADKSVRPLLDSRFEEFAAVFSPDGRYLAYVSDESGKEEVYVRSFPALDVREQISTGGGTEPVWSRDGRELFFRRHREMLAVDVATAPAFTAGRPRVLFETDLSSRPSSNLASYDVSADGKRFLMVRERSSAGGADMNVVLNWFEELGTLSPQGER